MKTLAALMLLAAAPAALAPAAPRADKIDPRVRESMATGARVNVVVLGSEQLLEDRIGLGAFQRANTGAKRRALRTETLERLKDLAAKARPILAKGLGAEEDVRPLWIVNAVAGRLTPEQIERAAGSEAVKYIYPAGALPRPATGTARTQEPPSRTRPPFTVEGKKVPWNLDGLGAPRVWRELGVTGEGALIAVFDGGVDYLRSDLRDNVWTNPREIANNGKDDDGNGLIDDAHGFNFARLTPDVRPPGNARQQQHGTLCTGIAVGDGTLGTVTGVAPRARFVPIVASGGAYNAAKGFEYALEQGADVMSMSFSLPGLGQSRGLWRRMAEHAVCAGLVLVSGAGNFQQTEKIPDQQRVPEAIPCVISAGGVDQKHEVPPFCSLGPVSWGDVAFYEDHSYPPGLVKPDVCGFPGAGYPVLNPAEDGYLDPNDRIRGNSFSSPHIAGTVALMLSANPDLTAWRVKEILEATARDLGEPGKDNRTGAGLADAYAAVKAAQAR